MCITVKFKWDTFLAWLRYLCLYLATVALVWLSVGILKHCKSMRRQPRRVECPAAEVDPVAAVGRSMIPVVVSSYYDRFSRGAQIPPHHHHPQPHPLAPPPHLLHLHHHQQGRRRHLLS